MELAGLVRRYAERFAGLGGDEHQVGSPLGAWLVLALAAPTADGVLREEIADALGTDVADAQRLVAELLRRPNEAVGAALAAWSKPGLTGLDAWLAELPVAVTTGDVPTQQEADQWARNHTLGLINTFPIDTRGVLILLASALATRVTWLRPFDLVDGTELRGAWGRQLTRALHAPADLGHTTSIVATDRAGTVAAHTALADAGLQVTSVIAAADVPRADVLAVAHDLAGTARGRRGTGSSVSLFDLPLGDSPLWTITERDARAGGEQSEAVLPAWQVESEHDLLTVPSLAFGAAARSLQKLAQVNGLVEAAQTAVAKFTRRGFEAAAVTALGIAVSGRMPPPPGPYRTATVRFAHPYAVIATTRATSNDPWDGLPVFAAWITRPDDASAG
jgi:hypothetical protein